jgi:Signal transduction histidine kinase
MIIIPLILLGLADLFLHHVINNRYLSPDEPRIENVLSQNSNTVAAIDNLIANDPDKLMDKSFLEKINQQGDKNFLFVIVERNGEFVDVPDRIDVVGLKAASLGLKSGVSPDPKGYLLLKYSDFKFTDKNDGSLYFLARDKPKGPADGIVFIVVLLLGLLINILISYRVASNIITPLGILNKATAEISKGNLDMAVESLSEDEVGELCRSFETMRTQLKEARNLSQSYENNRKELIANISHDLKTPITSIRGYVQGIMEGVASTPEKASKYIRIIYNNALQMDRLIDELFLFPSWI